MWVSNEVCTSMSGSELQFIWDSLVQDVSLVFDDGFGGGIAAPSIANIVYIPPECGTETYNGPRALTEWEKKQLASYIPKVDLDNAVLHDGHVPMYILPGYDAITRGNQIFISTGAYDPSSKTNRGISLLGHELIHVGQYRNGMTWASYLWSTRNGYRKSRFEKAAYAVSNVIYYDNLIDPNFEGCKKAK